MSASTFHEPIQLYDEQLARLAPFPVLTGVRQRSSSLVHVPTRRPLSQVDPNSTGQYSVFDDEAMPGILSKVLNRRTSLEAASIHKDTGGKLKITEKGRERRLSAGNWRARSSVASTSSNDNAASSSHQQQQQQTPIKRQQICSNDDDEPSPARSSNSHLSTPTPSSGTASPHAPRRVSPMQLDKVTNLARVPSSGAEEEDGGDNSEDSPSDTSITNQRARAYAALTGRGSMTNPSPCAPSSYPSKSGPQPGDSASLDMIARASLSQPSLPSQQSHPHYQPLTALNPNALPHSSSPSSGVQQQRRRTTSSNDAPMNNQHTASKASILHPNKTPRRSRVQSASALPTIPSNSSPRPPLASSRQVATGSPSPATPVGQRKNRRSLSQENSLLATRIARAFLARELGDNAITTRRNSSSSTPSKNWTSNESEQKELWLALHDGVLLCRLLNHIVPHASIQIDKRDLNSAKKANIVAFVTAARQHLPLQPHEFFDADSLYSGSPSGFERVLHTVCAIAEYVALKQHGLFQTSVLEASRSAESLLPPPELMLQIRAPSPSPPLASSGDVIMQGTTEMQGSSTSTTADGLLSPVQRRPGNAGDTSLARSPTLTSANGNKIRSRTASRPTSGSSLIPKPNTRSTSPASITDRATRPTHTHGVYGNNSDRRMCESAVEIMTVVREGEEQHSPPPPRRSASDHPKDNRGGHLSSSSPDCTPVKRAAAAADKGGYPGSRIRGGSAFSDSDASSSSELLTVSESGIPLPNARAIRLRQSIGHSPSSAAVNNDLLRGNSPRLVRKRLSADRPLPSRAVSTSPVPAIPASIPNVPFPQAPPLLIRARTSVGPAGEDINEDTEVSSADDGEPEVRRKDRTNSAEPTGDLFVRPRQHKRWNSEVHEAPVIDNRLSQEPAQMRTRHNSFMPASSPNRNSGEEQPSGRASGELRRRAPDRRQSMDASRQRLVVREPGKVPITYQLGECIGRGQFGSVYRALNIHTGSVVAVKRIRLANKSEEEASQLQKEVDLLKRLSHPSVVKYEGLVRTENYLNIVMEYVENGSLHNTLAAFGILPEALVASYVVKILEGLSYLHRMQVIHRDLKAANILTTKKGNIKLSDFGVSLQLNAVHSTIENADATGTPNWMAPEVIKLEKATYASDIWSLACTVVELLTGKPPYANMLAMTAMFKIVEDDMPPLPTGCSPELQDFLGLCFAKDPRHRPSADALFEHTWLRKHWSNHKQTLRAQDSIPFFRRISSEYRRPQFEQQDSPASDTLPELDRSVSSPCHSSLMTADASEMDYGQDTVTIVEAIEMRAQGSESYPGGSPMSDMDAMTSEMLRQGKDVTTPLVQTSPTDAYPFPQVIRISGQPFQSPVTPRPGPSHSFVKTTFSKPIECKLCHKPVKKYAVLCEDCGLICHASCKEFAPLTCDLRSQLLGLSMPPSFIPPHLASPALGVSVPTMEPSPMTSPAQYAFHSKFGIGKGRRPKGSPSSEDVPSSAECSPGPQSPDSPRRSNKGIALLRSRTQSPDGVGFHYGRPRPASYASSGSFPRSHEMQGSISSSNDSHPLSTSSIPEEALAPPPVLPTISPPPLQPQERQASANLKPPKHGRSKSMRRQSGGECIIS